MRKLDKVVNLIVNLIDEAIKQEERRWDFQYERTTMQDFLQEIYGDMTSKEFKEEVKYIVTNYDNENYEKGIKNEFINMMDDGSIEDEGEIYTYRQIMNIVRKKAFKDIGEEE